MGRVHALDLDDATFPTFSNPTRSPSEVSSWGAGVNWYLNRNVKLALSYENTAFEGGAPTGDRTSERGLFGRIQFAF